MSKVYSIVMKVRLDCPSCHKKITKALCSVCICDLQTKNFDEKENTVTVTGTFDPEMFVKKICRKVGKFILSYEVKEEKGAAKKEKAAKGEKNPAAEEKKAKNEDKEDDKKKGNDKKKDAAPNAEDKALDIPEVVKSAPKAAAPAAAIETPIAGELYAVPAFGAPANWGYYGNYPYGYYPKAFHDVHERPPCPCGCSYGQNHYGQQNGIFSEEESTCSVM